MSCVTDVGGFLHQSATRCTFGEILRLSTRIQTGQLSDPGPKTALEERVGSALERELAAAGLTGQAPKLPTYYSTKEEHSSIVGRRGEERSGK